MEVEEEAIAKVAELETHLSEVHMECERLKVRPAGCDTGHTSTFMY